MTGLPCLYTLCAASEKLGNLFGFLGDTVRLIMEHPVTFGLIVGVLTLVLIWIMVASAKEKKRRQGSTKPQTTVFIPVETPDLDIEAEYFIFRDKIIAAKDQLDRKMVVKIKNKGPEALADIVAAYDKARPEIKHHLKQLVKEERLMERYSRRLILPGYSQGVLLEAWHRFPDPETLKDFIEMLASPNEAIQLAGTRLLSAMKDPQILTALTAALMWPEHFVPARVAEVFAAMGSQGARLLAYLLPKVEDKHKVRVLETIAKTESPYPPENVIALLTHKDAAIRSAAALALGSGRMVEGVEPLLICASDRDWQVRAAVAKALGMIGDQRAVPILEMLSQDNEGWVATVAKASLDIFAKA